MEKIYSEAFPIKVLLNWKEFIHYSGFNINRSVEQFIDTFSITCNNPVWSYSTEIPIGCVVSFWYAWVEFFRWYVEKKEVTLQEVWSFMTLSGREEIVSICETDVDPQQSQFKNTTDNAIIKKLLAGYSYQLDLGTAYPVKEYSADAWMKVAQVIEDISKYSDSIIIKKGATLIKKKIPLWPTGPGIPLQVTKVDGKYMIYNSKILGIKLSEDITKATWYMGSASYQRGKNKKSITGKTENKILTSWDYAKKLRNQTTLKWTPLKNYRYFQSTAKEKAEVDIQTKRAQRETDIVIEVEVTLAWIFSAELLDTVNVFIEQEKIMQYMYIESLKFSLDRNNRAITVMTIKPYPSV